MSKLFEQVLNRTGSRHGSFSMMLAHLSRFKDPVIVETGCVRALDDYSAGYSTVLFDAFLAEHGGRLYSVDNNAKHAEFARSLTSEDRTTILVGDSLRKLYEIKEPECHLLYLDSLDYKPEDQHPSALQALMELLAAARLCVPGKTLVAVDDNFPFERGKGAYIREFMRRGPHVLLYDGLQVVWGWRAYE